MKLDVVYFAWVRERIGKPREVIETGAATVAGLVEELRALEARYDAAFQDTSAMRVAVDQEWVVVRRSLWRSIQKLRCVWQASR